jgi:putative hemolysin
VHGRACVHAGARQRACALWMGSMRQNVAKQGRVSTKSGCAFPEIEGSVSVPLRRRCNPCR